MNTDGFCVPPFTSCFYYFWAKALWRKTNYDLMESVLGWNKGQNQWFFPSKEITFFLQRAVLPGDYRADSEYGAPGWSVCLSISCQSSVCRPFQHLHHKRFHVLKHQGRRLTCCTKFGRWTVALKSNRLARGMDCIYLHIYSSKGGKLFSCFRICQKK